MEMMNLIFKRFKREDFVGCPCELAEGLNKGILKVTQRQNRNGSFKEYMIIGLPKVSEFDRKSRLSDLFSSIEYLKRNRKLY